MRKHVTIAALLAGAATIAMPAAAKEGMYTPDQLPEIAADLRETGLEISPEALSDLTGFPMGAIVSLGGCSASFVSPEGLVVTNHHCARGSVQYNSTAENNYLENGFLAKTKGAELQAAPGSRIYVTVADSDVTERMRAGTESLTPNARYDTIESMRLPIRSANMVAISITGCGRATPATSPSTAPMSRPTERLRTIRPTTCRSSPSTI